MRRAILALLMGACLVAPAGAAAKTVTATAGGVTAKLSYGNGAQGNASTTSEQLLITEHGKPVYEQPVPAKGCFKVCAPEPRGAVSVVRLIKPGGESVVLSLFTGGADCCSIDLVYTESADIPGDWASIRHNFGEAGARLEDVGPHGATEFVSADPAFYCQFTACYESGLPLQIFEFRDAALVNVTKEHPALISADAERWLKVYNRNPKQGLGAISAFIADEENLDDGTAIATVVKEQENKGNLSPAFLARLQHLLEHHGYKSYI